MLILSRRKEQSVSIELADGRRIEARVLGFNGRRVVLGIAAPEGVAIRKGELRPEPEENHNGG